MKTRAEIKEIAKQRFYGKYWLCVGVNVLVVFIVGSAAGASAGIGSLLLTGPLTIGLNAFCLSIFRGSDEGASLDAVFDKGFSNFGRKLGGYLWMQLFTFLWSLLFVVPGIVKALSYAMTPYILTDCPNVPAQDALKLSMRMMKGHKWELFVFYLSFLGWGVLNALTLGLLGVFFLAPYQSNALAGYYDELKTLSLNTGALTAEEIA